VWGGHCCPPAGCIGMASGQECPLHIGSIGKASGQECPLHIGAVCTDPEASFLNCP